MLRLLALDFDGVIADSAPEAFVVALRTYCELRPEAGFAGREALLEGGAASVTEVCLEVGFDSLGSFSSLFRREYGVPPSAFRARSSTLPPIRKIREGDTRATR